MANNQITYVNMKLTQDGIYISGLSSLYPNERRELINQIKMLLLPYKEYTYDVEY